VYERGLIPLSPSRAADFKSCPQLFKYRVIDRLPEPGDPYSLIGTVVHAVLERIFGMPPEERSVEQANRILQEVWEEIRGSEEAPDTLTHKEEMELLGQSERLLANYFLLEDPARTDAFQLEWWVEHATNQTLLRGIIDRVEALPSGEWVLVDYKTGHSPSDGMAFGSFFGLRFYALLCWRVFGKLPKELRLVHLKKPEVLTLIPTPQMLEGLERQLEAVSGAIRRALRTGDFRARPGRRCGWCPHREICPAWQVTVDASPSDLVSTEAGQRA